MAEKKFRGSRKHILEWLDTPGFVEDINQHFKDTGAKLSGDDWWKPCGRLEPAEIQLTKSDLLERIRTNDEAREIKESLKEWWLAPGANGNTPNWDFASTCTIDGKKGLLLVEAKAHVNELSRGGKLLKDDASSDSRDNHDRIGSAIAEAKGALNCLLPGAAVKISRDSHYQLSNRVAWSWKLASLGIPNVLVYLGFIGDSYFTDCFSDHNAWHLAVDDYFGGVLPTDFPWHDLDCGPATMRLEIISHIVGPKTP